MVPRCATTRTSSDGDNVHVDSACNSAELAESLHDAGRVNAVADEAGLPFTGGECEYKLTFKHHCQLNNYCHQSVNKHRLTG